MPNLRFSARARQTNDKLRTGCAILPLGTDLKLDSSAKALDKDSAGAVKAALASGDFKAKAGETLVIHSTGDAARIILVGTGSERPDRAALLKVSTGIAKAVLGSKATEAQLHAASLKLPKSDSDWFFERLGRDLSFHTYRYATTVSSKATTAPLKRLQAITADASGATNARKALQRGAQIGQGVNVARQLANLPGNHCTPEHLAKEARRLARGHDKARCKVYNEKAMADMGMHSLLSVTAGTATPARLIVLEYMGGKKSDAPHVLVGKGITFDSGGISLKPGAKMDEMKFDMGGAASVLGTFEAIMAMNLPLNVVGIIAAAENMPSGTATKPGDVVTSMAGITIEILNTDAEGRLVLCDALTYAKRYKPASVVDIATLTGACVVALGSHASGLYANDDGLAEELLNAGTNSHDRAWRMPLWDDYQRQLDSNFADVANIGGPGAGSVTAACFLARFTGDYRWAHLDIAGSAWDSSPKGATGRPVGLLTQYLCDRAATA